MDGILILLGIVWVVVSAVSNKKRKQAREEAARRAQEAGQDGMPIAPATPAPQQPQARHVPVAARPAQPVAADDEPFDPYFGGAAPVHKPKIAQTAPRKPMETTVHSAETSMSGAPTFRMREAVQTQLRVTDAAHKLEASSFTGHAHVESSLTGKFDDDCPPASSRTAQRQQGAATGNQGTVAFDWNVGDVTRGLILSEILGKPKALQRKA